MKNTDALSLALSLGREINRQIERIETKRGKVATIDASNPFAGVTRGKNDDARKLRNLVGALNDLGAAHKRFAAVAAAFATACDELKEATGMACNVVGVSMESLAKSLGETGHGATAATDATTATIEASEATTLAIVA